jgi:hypothetical protein
MRFQAFVLMGLAASGVGSATAQEPVLARSLTPTMIDALEGNYTAAAVDCLRTILPKVLATEYEYLFTYDPRLGQLWLISLAALEDERARPHICTPEGYAATLEETFEAIMAGRMGMPY